MEQIPIVGDPDICAAQIERYASEAGVDHFILRIRYPGQDDVARARMLRLISNEVLPRARAVGQARPKEMGKAT